MTNNVATTYLKYANLPSAAKTFLENAVGKNEQLAIAIKQRNNRSSKFPDMLADDFSSKWKVVAYQAITKTGFSGTLFQCTENDAALGYTLGEKVMSFRSTEFL